MFVGARILAAPYFLWKVERDKVASLEKELDKTCKHDELLEKQLGNADLQNQLLRQQIKESHSKTAPNTKVWRIASGFPD